MQPDNPVVGGVALRRPAIQSPNYLTGSTGWTINADGSAEFSNAIFRGTLSAGSITAGSIGSSNITGSTFTGGTITESTIKFDTTGGKLLLYTTTSNVSTFTTSGSFVVPAGVTSLKVECWGAGGAGPASPTSGIGGGGGGGEYAAEYTLTVTPAETLTYTVGAGATGTGNGGDTFLQRAGSDLVRAHGGTTSNGVAGGAGGTGSAASVHFSGGSGGTAAGSGGNGSGGGGGSSAGTSAAGGTGGNATTLTGGTGGSAPTGGGGGGAGGSANASNGANGSTPGGGGGGEPTGNFGPGNGAGGQIRISYTTGTTLLGSVAPTAGSDGLGNNYPAGFAINSGINLSTGSWITYTPAWTASTTNPTFPNGSLLGRYMYLNTHTVVAEVFLTPGASATKGSGNYFIGLPVAAATQDANGACGSFWYNDSGAALRMGTIICDGTNSAGGTQVSPFLTSGAQLSSTSTTGIFSSSNIKFTYLYDV